MNGIFKVISTILMVALICFLVWFLVSYYSQGSYQTPKNEITVNTPIMNDEEKNVPVTNNDEQDSDEQNNSIINAEDEEIIDSIIEKNEEDKKNNESMSSRNKPFFLSTSEKISNDEKQEVLNEIDKALMDLLQVVDKVKPVDETRLGIDESEVQPWKKLYFA